MSLFETKERSDGCTSRQRLPLGPLQPKLSAVGRVFEGLAQSLLFGYIHRELGAGADERKREAIGRSVGGWRCGASRASGQRFWIESGLAILSSRQPLRE